MATPLRFITEEHRPRRDGVRWGRLGSGSYIDRRSHCHAAAQMSYAGNDMGIDGFPKCLCDWAGRPPTPGRRTVRPSPVTTEEGHMLSENHLDLEIALRKIHELSMADGDLGYAYWHEVGQLLRRAAGMQAEIDSLTTELGRCRAMLARKTV
jgi:hypothetical protein